MAKKLSTGLIVLISIGVVLLLTVFWFIGSYNGENFEKRPFLK